MSCMAKVIHCHASHFQGVYFDKVLAEDQNKHCIVCFEETKHVGRFDLDTVVCELISAVNEKSDVVEVDSEEIEEIINSANSDI